MIKDAMSRDEIVIEPFDASALGSNSYDVHLGDTLKTYVGPLDCKIMPMVRTWQIPAEGFVLCPGQVYLGVTREYTEAHKHVSFLDGKSSVGRLGITIHCTAGRGDVGFFGHWTLEIHVTQAVRVYAGMPVGQLVYFETGSVEVPYNVKPSAKYTERSTDPQESKMYRNFLSKGEPTP
jgi:dCTP deaminase